MHERKPQIYRKIIKEQYNKETFNRFLLELSYYLNTHLKVKEKIKEYISKIGETKKYKYAKIKINKAGKMNRYWIESMLKKLNGINKYGNIKIKINVKVNGNINM